MKYNRYIASSPVLVIMHLYSSEVHNTIILNADSKSKSVFHGPKNPVLQVMIHHITVRPQDYIRSGHKTVFSINPYDSNVYR